ncbi:MAG TPA: DsbA family protein [Candidatus Kapabacteria bacterium]|nr:DsbA family protein [Candidatus Kapabacteria bacterium]
MKIEFFHDVLCAWCFAFSPRMRKLHKEHPEIEIVQRSFALAPSKESLSRMFGNPEQAKKEIIGHWRLANQNDDEHRINADLMETKPFDYPYSMPGLMACKSAEFQRGTEGHWDYFDRVQKAHLVDCEDINDPEVLIKCAEDIGLDMERFKKDFQSDTAKHAVIQDIELARHYGINGVPSIVIDGTKMQSGAISYSQLLRVLGLN